MGFEGGECNFVVANYSDLPDALRRWRIAIRDHEQLSLFEEARNAAPDLSDEALMRVLCEQLLDEGEVEGPPTPVQMLASIRGITDIKVVDQPFAGVLAPGESGLAVRVRRGDGRERQRFTICHEAGHTLLPGFRQKRQYRCNGERTWLERMCDVAGAELLLPKRFFEPRMAAGDFDLKTVEELAWVFDASIEASARRAVNLHSEPALLLVLSDRHKPAENGREGECSTKLRLDYSVRQGEWPHLMRHKSASEARLGRTLEEEILSETGNIDELSVEEIGPVQVSAKRYGKQGRVLALVRRTS